MALAKDIMIKELITIREDTPIIEAITVMLQNYISSLPVVDENMRLLGILTEKDVLELSFFNFTNDEKAVDYMDRDIITMNENSELLDVCECLMREGFKRIPILSNGRLVGIISRRDMLKYILAM